LIGAPIDAHRRGDDGREIAQEALPREALGARPDRLSIEALSLALVYPVRERLDGLVVDEDACHAVLDRFAGPSGSKGNHGRSAGLCFDRNHPKVFDPGQKDRGRPLVQLTDLLVAAPAEEFHVTVRPAPRGERELLESRLFRASANDFEGHAYSPAGLDRHVYSFVRHKG